MPARGVGGERRASTNGCVVRIATRSNGSDGASVEEIIRRAVLAAFPDRVARGGRTPSGTRLGASREDRVVLGRYGDSGRKRASFVRRRGSSRSRPEIDSHPSAREKRQTRVWMASAIEPEWLIDLFPGAVEDKVEITWSAEHDRVHAVERLVYDRLVLDERPAGTHANEAIAALLAEKAIAAGIATFAGGEAFDALSERLAFVTKGAPDLASRAGSSRSTRRRLTRLLVKGLVGKRSFAEIRERSLLDEIRAAIGFAACRASTISRPIT